MKHFTISSVLLAVFFMLLVACSPTLPPSSPGGTFTVETIFQPLTGLSYSVPGINISGNWQSDLAGAQGSAAPVNGTTNSNALAVFLGSRAPATWKFTWNTPARDSGCRGVSVILTISAPQGAGVFGCAEVIAEAPLLRISPSTINIANPPETVVISNASHGGFRYISAMPESQYIDDSGIIEGISDASTISSDGTSITGFTPDVSSAALGTYAGIAGNVSGSSLDVVGGGSVHLINQPVKCNPNCPP